LEGITKSAENVVASVEIIGRLSLVDEELSERLNRIESHLAHVEHLCDQLNQVVLEQGRQLARLTAQQQRACETIESIELERIKGTQQKPPHYQ
jgi:uncharacterized coiled-coil protein SlyX